MERLELLPYALRRCFADSGVGGGPDSAPVRDRLAADGGSSPNTVSDSISCEDMSGRAESFAGGRREEGGDMGALSAGERPLSAGERPLSASERLSSGSWKPCILWGSLSGGAEVPSA